MKILSVTSHVCFGHVGAQASVLPLQRLGHDVCLVPTVLLSNHPGYGGMGGGPVKLIRLDDLMRNLAERGLLAQCGAVHSSYLGQPGTAAILRRSIDDLRGQSPHALYLCDPVFGDNGRLYVAEGVVDDIRSQLLPVADLLTPNVFELAVLSGRDCGSLAQVLAACRALQQAGPDTVVCTSAEVTAEHVAIVAVAAEAAYLVRVPHVEAAPNGTGDAFAAILFGRLLNGSGFERSLAWAASAVHGLIVASAGERELAVIEAQHEIVAPTLDVVIERMG